MQRFLLFFFLLINFPAFSQKKLEGTFKRGYGFESKGFTFYKNGTFEYFDSDCLYSIRGKGSYTIKKNKLKLKFIGNEFLESSFEINGINCKDQEKKITITVIDKETGQPMSGVEIEFLYPKKAMVFRTTNENGECSLRGGNGFLGEFFDEFGDSTFIATIKPHYKYSTYSKYSFEFKLRPCTQIKIALAEKPHAHNQKNPSGTVWKYRIKKFKEEYSEGIVLHEITGFMRPDEDEEIFIKKNRLLISHLLVIHQRLHHFLPTKP